METIALVLLMTFVGYLIGYHIGYHDCFQFLKKKLENFKNVRGE